MSVAFTKWPNGLNALVLHNLVLLGVCTMCERGSACALGDAFCRAILLSLFVEDIHELPAFKAGARDRHVDLSVSAMLYRHVCQLQVLLHQRWMTNRWCSANRSVKHDFATTWQVIKKAEILSNQFKSVFTHEDTTAISHLQGPDYPTIPSLEVTTLGVTKLLNGINPKKAQGPDEIPCRIVKELDNELTPALTAIIINLWKQENCH